MIIMGHWNRGIIWSGLPVLGIGKIVGKLPMLMLIALLAIKDIAYQVAFAIFVIILAVK